MDVLWKKQDQKKVLNSFRKKDFVNKWRIVQYVIN